MVRTSASYFFRIIFLSISFKLHQISNDVYFHYSYSIMGKSTSNKTKEYKNLEVSERAKEIICAAYRLDRPTFSENFRNY